MKNIDREASEKEYISSVIEKMRFFIHKGLLKPIEEYQTIHNWVQQFPEGSLVPYFLLDTLVMLTRDQVEASLKNIIEQIKSSIYSRNPTLSDAQLFSLFEDHIAHSVFISACIPGHTAGGAPETLRSLRKVIGNQFSEIAVNDICREVRNHNIRNVYIVDDFIGTGKTIETFMKSEHLCEKCICGKEIGKCSLLCAMRNNPDIQFAIISVVLHEKGKSHIRDSIKDIQLLSSFAIDNDYDLLSESCTLYRDSEYTGEIRRIVSEILKEYDMDKNQYALHLSLGVSDSFPNNSLELFWWSESESWKPLAPRRH